MKPDHRNIRPVLTGSERSRGEPLSTELREFFENGFGCDLKQIRVYDGPEANELNRQHRSLAFAHRESIYFRRGAYSPETQWGRWLLAHELAHCLQQRSGCSTCGASSRQAMLEREANDAATAVFHGSKAFVPPRPGCPSVQTWDMDMHLGAVYLTGRLLNATHTQAMRVCWASQSLDDLTSRLVFAGTQDAPTTKAWGALFELLSIPFSFGKSMEREANILHSLGLSYVVSEEVAREGIRLHDDLVFGYGLHTIGDFLPHANLSGVRSVGHQNGYNEDGSRSDSMEEIADSAYHNPQKALDTISIFLDLWTDFTADSVNPSSDDDGPTNIDSFDPSVRQFFSTFVGMPDPGNIHTVQQSLIEDHLSLFHMSGLERNQLFFLWNLSKRLRHKFWMQAMNGDHAPDWMQEYELNTNIKSAFYIAQQIWLNPKNLHDKPKIPGHWDKFMNFVFPGLFRWGVDDVNMAENRWGSFAGTFGATDEGLFVDPTEYYCDPYQVGNKLHY